MVFKSSINRNGDGVNVSSLNGETGDIILTSAGNTIAITEPTLNTINLESNIPSGLSYQGTWDALNNIPTLTSGVGTYGFYYIVSAAGNTDLDGITDWEIGDWAIFNGTAWQKIDNSQAPAVWGEITGNINAQIDLQDEFGTKANTDDLATVAFSGSFNDLSDVPNIVNSFNGSAGDITLNQGSNITITNDGGGSYTISASAGGGGVSSVNTLVGGLTIAPGNANVTITDNGTDTIYIAATGDAGTVAWGDITGDILDQTDLQNEFDTKYDASNPDGYISDLSGFTTTDLAEGSNLYFTNARAITANTGLWVGLTGNESVAGVKTFTSYPELPSSDPTTDYQAATKIYVDNAVVSSIFRQGFVIAVLQNTPPGSPSIGDRYVVGTSPTGAWVGHAEAITTWNGSAWTFETPSVDWSVTIATTGVQWIYNQAGDWVPYGVAPVITASNGLTLSTQDVKLGGALTQNTTITAGSNALTVNLDSTGDFAIQDAGKTVFQVDDSGNTRIGATAASSGQLTITPTATATRGVVIAPITGQTANLFETRLPGASTAQNYITSDSRVLIQHTSVDRTSTLFDINQTPITYNVGTSAATTIPMAERFYAFPYTPASTITVQTIEARLARSGVITNRNATLQMRIRGDSLGAPGSYATGSSAQSPANRPAGLGTAIAQIRGLISSNGAVLTGGTQYWISLELSALPVGADCLMQGDTAGSYYTSSDGITWTPQTGFALRSALYSRIGRAMDIDNSFGNSGALIRNNVAPVIMDIRGDMATCYSGQSKYNTVFVGSSEFGSVLSGSTTDGNVVTGTVSGTGSGFNLTVSGTGRGSRIQVTGGGTAQELTAGTGVGNIITSTTGNNNQWSTTTGLMLLATATPAVNNSITNFMHYRVATSDAANGANGLGGRIQHSIESSSGSMTESHRLDFYYTNATAGALNSAWGWWTRDNNTLSQRMTLASDGSLTVTGALAASNLSGTNTGDQTNITGNAGTVTTINGRISAGTNITLGGTGTAADPYVINSSGGGGTVDSVNGQTGVVVLDADDIDDTATTNKFVTSGEIADFHVPATIGTANGLSISGQAISMATASGSVTGALTSTDWTTFNNKQATLTTGNLSGTTNQVIVSATRQVIGGSVTLSLPQNIGTTSTMALGGLNITQTGDYGLSLITTGTRVGASEVRIINATGTHDTDSNDLYGVFSAPTGNFVALGAPTNNYAFYGNPSGGTTDWGLYITGEDNNYLSNKLSFGSTTGIEIATNTEVYDNDFSLIKWGEDSYAAYNGYGFEIKWSNGDVGSNALRFQDTAGNLSYGLEAAYFNGTHYGNGASLSALNANNISSGTLATTRGGTGQSSYTVGDILYASTTTALSKLADVSAGSYLRSGGTSTAPLWSTLKLPNSATANRVVYASSTNTWADSANLTFNGTTLTASQLALGSALGVGYGGTGLTSLGASNRIPYATTSTALSTSANFTYDGTAFNVSANVSAAGTAVITNSHATGLGIIALCDNIPFRTSNVASTRFVDYYPDGAVFRDVNTSTRPFSLVSQVLTGSWGAGGGDFVFKPNNVETFRTAKLGMATITTDTAIGTQALTIDQNDSDKSFIDWQGSVTSSSPDSATVSITYYNPQGDDGSWQEAGWLLQEVNGSANNYIRFWTYCVTGDTMIDTPDGKKRIDALAVGDEVYSWDNKCKTTVISVVSEFEEHPNTPDYYIINGGLKITGNHNMFINGEWKRAEKALVGDRLLGMDGAPIIIESIEYVGDVDITTYNIKLDTKNKNYFADGVCIHNAKCPRIDAFIGGKWVEVGRAIMYNDGKANERQWDIVLTKPAQHFRMVEDEPEVSYVEWIKGDGERWRFNETIITSAASAFGATDGSIHNFSFSKPVAKLETFGYYEVVGKTYEES